MLLSRHTARAVLTTDGIVTADSIKIDDSDPGYSNCLSGVIDNQLIPGAYFATGSKCCASTTLDT